MLTLSQPALAFKEDKEGDCQQEQDAKDYPKVAWQANNREPRGVHPKDARDKGEREGDKCQDRERLHNLVLFGRE
jgi:hypothetical protein